MLAFAGLWGGWKDPANGHWLQTYTIITTEANELMAPVQPDACHSQASGTPKEAGGSPTHPVALTPWVFAATSAYAVLRSTILRLPGKGPLVRKGDLRHMARFSVVGECFGDLSPSEATLLRLFDNLSKGPFWRNIRDGLA